MKHLILTGKNGSGKTSVIEAMVAYLNHVLTDPYFEDRKTWLDNAQKERSLAV